MINPSINRKKSGPWLYFLITFSWSWIFWISSAASGFDATSLPGNLLLGLGGLGPAISAIFLIAVTKNRNERRDYWQRVIDFKRIGADWYLRLFLLIPICTLFTVGTSFYYSGNLESITRALGEMPKLGAILPFLIFMLFFGPVPEELGWRGYALDGLQSKWNALSASLILGSIWSIWHLPLFFMEGTYQQTEVGLGTLDFWVFMVGMVVSSILFTWIYNNTHRSTLSAILFHFSINLSGEIFSLSGLQRCYQTLLLLLSALVVLAVWGGRTMTIQINNEKEVGFRDTSILTRVQDRIKD
jgi:membrane protease YdiL (CAAX protease family)